MTDDHGNVKVSLPYEYGWTYEVFSRCWQEYPEDPFIRLKKIKLCNSDPAPVWPTYADEYSSEEYNLIYVDNGDGKVNMRDYALLQRYMIGKSTDILLPPCDLTGDGKVNMRDYALMQRLLMGKQIEYPA